MPVERGGQGLPVGASPEPRSGKRAGTSAGVRDGTETSALGGCERPALASENSQSGRQCSSFARIRGPQGARSRTAALNSSSACCEAEPTATKGKEAGEQEGAAQVRAGAGSPAASAIQLP